LGGDAKRKVQEKMAILKICTAQKFTDSNINCATAENIHTSSVEG